MTRSTLILAVVIAVAACGRGGGGDNAFDPTPVANNGPQPAAEEPTPAPTVVTGQFKDANVTGLSFVSGSQSGVTGSHGEFTCMSDQHVAFSIGAVELGSSACMEAVTPMNLFAGSTLDTREVLNVVRFLLLLDDDGDASNGIYISDDVHARAQSWAQVDFSALDLGDELASIINDIYVDEWPVLVDKSTARAHLLATGLCLLSGVYWLDLEPDGSPHLPGILTILPAEVNGVVLGGASWVDEGSNVAGVYTAPAAGMIYADVTRIEFTDTTGQPNFQGEFVSATAFKGQWAAERSFEGHRAAGDPYARYRFVGFETADPCPACAAYSIDLLDDDKVIVDEFWLDSWEGPLYWTYQGDIADGRFSLQSTFDPDATIEGQVDVGATPPVAQITFINVSDGSSSTHTTYGCRLN